MSNEKGNCRLGALLGEGRSGTTWLGSIISSHPEVAYRFEPFHRLQKQNTGIRELLEIMNSSAFSSTDISSLYRTLLPAEIESEKPPFFSKHYRTQLSLGRSLLWPIARKSSLAARLFRSLYTPQESPTLVFKEVGLASPFCGLIARTEMPVVYIMRHPCAVVWSLMRGQQKSLMPSGRRQVLGNLLANYKDPILTEKYKGRLETLTVSEKEALLWRINVERVVRAHQVHSSVLLVVYEKLVESPLEVAAKVFNHFGLELAQESISFIEENTGGGVTSRIKRGEIAINSYFTVYRNPKVSRDSWKDEMPREDQARVMEVVRDSEPFALATGWGLWN